MNRGRLSLLFPLAFLMIVFAVMLVGALRHGRGGLPTGELSRDPVCGMDVNGGIASRHGGMEYRFCTRHCKRLFDEKPASYAQLQCEVCRAEGVRAHDAAGESVPATWQGSTYLLCSVEHRDAFRADPSRYFLHTMWGIPTWLYYASIAFILLISFGIIEWSAGRKGSGATPRLDLLRLRWLRAALVHPATRFVARGLMVGAFVLIIVAGLFGRQLPARNIAPLLTWTVWWGGLVWIVAYLGKAWCYVCPWDAIADWAEGLRLWGRKKEGLSLGLRWPRFARNIWPATILFIGLTWIELGFGVTMNPRVTAWLALAMLALGFGSAFLFDRRSFCLYGCLVGRISGLYALFAPVEIRARDTDVCRSCSTSSCLKGNGVGEPCPTYQYLGSMDQNTYCISCMECVKSCEHENVALNLRPWGEDLVAHHRPRSDEAYLALLMLSLTGFHGLTMTGAWKRMVEGIGGSLGVGETTAFSLGMAGITVFPVALYAFLVALSRWAAAGASLSYRDYFIRYAYALLPIAFFYHLAHNSEHLLMEGQRVLSLVSDPLGYDWNLLGTAGWELGPLVDLPTLWLLQVFFVMVGHVYSLWAARRAAGAIFTTPSAAFRSQLPMLVAMILFSVMSLWLLKQPMEMRTSAM